MCCDIRKTCVLEDVFSGDLERYLWEIVDARCEIHDARVWHFKIIIVHPYLRETIVSKSFTSWVTSCQDDGTTGLTHKLRKRLLVVVFITIVVEVICFDICDDGDLWMIVEKMSLVLTSLDDEVLIT